VLQILQDKQNIYDKKHRTVPWRTEGLPVARKGVNVFRRKYKRTRNNNNNLCDHHQTDYQVEKAQYQAKIKNAKIVVEAVL
jgi:hypothetical protein